MRAIFSARLLLVPAALLAAACDDSSNPIAPEEPPVAEAEAPEPKPTTGPLEALAYWADGYLYAANVAGTVTPASFASFNRSGGAMTVTKVAGTTGRYVARLRNLTALLGGKSTIQVTDAGVQLEPAYCKPVGAFLVRDSVEVRCYRVGTGAAVNSDFTLSVLGKRDDRAFAFANLPASTNYAPAAAGSWNPAGPMRVYRDGVGRYRVVFTGFRARIPAGSWGHVQVKAVGTTKAHCVAGSWQGATNLEVVVACSTPAGVPTDSKFTTLVTPPAAHLAYVWADQAPTPSYSPPPAYRWNPVGGAVTITRHQAGAYTVQWTGIDAEIRDLGNVQVTAWGDSRAQCKVADFTSETVSVLCHGPNGLLMDARYFVLLGS